MVIDLTGRIAPIGGLVCVYFKKRQKVASFFFLHILRAGCRATRGKRAKLDDDEGGS